MVEEQPRGGLGPPRLIGPCRAADEEHVLPAVAVGIEYGDTRSQRLGQILPAERTGIVRKIQPRLGGRIDEAEPGARLRCRPKGKGGGTERNQRIRPRHPRVSARDHCGSTSPFLTASSTSSVALCR